ncbi:MAG: DUF4175 family protein [Amphiplicatus sp.]
MTIELRQPGPGSKGREGEKSRTRPGPLAVRAARAVLFWERLWPALLPALAPGFIILILALFGVFAAVPSWLHWLALAAAGAVTVGATIRYGREASLPTRREALERLERDGAVAHAPLQALEDRPFGAGAQESPLWRAHLQDMARRAKLARLRAPRATADDRDPHALRFAAIGLFIVALVVAGPDRDARLASALTPNAAFKGGGAVADLWIEPPPYTGKAPIFLLRSGGAVSGSRAQIDAPEGSKVIATAADLRGVRLSITTSDEETKAVAADGQLRLPLKSGLVRMRIGGAEGRWPVAVIADTPPLARFIEPPATTDDARLAIAVAVEDDYGIASASLRLKLDPDQPRPLDAPALDEASIRAERVIELDGLAGETGERRFDLDLQADPWAGLKVIGRLVVRDGAGKEGATEEAAFALPARPFFNPLARAVVEQRQTLAVAPAEWHRAGRSFDALTLAPEAFYERPTDYLLVRTAFWRVMRQGGKDFSKTVSEFWPLALQLEDEALELARRRLEAAQDALRQALERGASDSEVSRLVEELREAMRQYLQALAESGQSMAEGEGGQGQSLNESDLEQMLDSIRDLSQSGAQNAARQALSDLENLLNNLRLSSRGGGQGQNPGQQGQGQSGQGGPAGAAGDLIGRQRDLANRSFERSGEPGATGDDLAREEGALSDDLRNLLDQLRAGESDPGGEASSALGEALTEMGRAEEALEGGDFGAANTAMERAIAGLRDGAEALAQEEARQAREGRGEGQSGPAVDPLGRPIGDAASGGVDVPEGLEGQRARDVLNELRRRLSDGKRSEEEIEYLERLLERF